MKKQVVDLIVKDYVAFAAFTLYTNAITFFKVFISTQIHCDFK